MTLNHFVRENFILKGLRRFKLKLSVLFETEWLMFCLIIFPIKLNIYLKGASDTCSKYWISTK